MLKHASFFTGIEGFGFAADAIGWKNVLHCEKEKRLLELLKYYYSDAASYEDITKADFTKHRGTIDVLSGGFPCQPYSSAGLRKGTDDERHLWPEMLRGIREIQPTWVVGENVRGIISWNAGLVFEQVQSDLEAEGYEVQAFLLPASGVNAPHERYRTWFVAYKRLSRTLQTTGGGNLKSVLDTNGRGREEGICSGDRNIAYSNLQNGCLLPGYATRNGKENEEITITPNFIRNEYASNPSSNRNERFASAGDRKNQNKAEWANFFEQTIGFGTERFAPKSNNCDTNSKRCKMYENGTIPNGKIITDWRYNERAGTNWINFPTQSPVCNGNDGIPTESLRSFILHNSGGILTEKEIDQIVSKTITTTQFEIIKAGGNAIVPQVAMQIFKAIDLYTKQFS